MKVRTIMHDNEIIAVVEENKFQLMEFNDFLMRCHFISKFEVGDFEIKKNLEFEKTLNTTFIECKSDDNMFNLRCDLMELMS